MRGKTLVVPKHTLRGWGVFKPETAVAAGLGGAIGGAIAGSIAEQQGIKELNKHGIKDPAEGVAKSLEDMLVKKSGVKRLQGAPMIVDDHDPKKIAGKFPTADYILEVRSIAWMGMYYPMTLTKYRVMHTMRMRLIERSTGRVIAQGFSAYQTDDKENAPDFDGIYADGARFLRQEFKKSSDQAVGMFSDQL